MAESIFNLAVQISDFFESPAGMAFLVPIKVIFVWLSFALFIGLIVVIWKLRVLNKAILEAEEFLTAPPARIPKFVEKWEAIRAKAESDNPNDFKFAVIEADAMLNDVLDRAGFIGDMLGDKLKGVEKGQLANIDALWAAHRLRNVIAHDISVRVSPAEARQAVEIYERTLEELEAI